MTERTWKGEMGKGKKWKGGGRVERWRDGGGGKGKNVERRGRR